MTLSTGYQEDRHAIPPPGPVGPQTVRALLWQLDHVRHRWTTARARDCLAAYDHGINFFDSAEVYLGGGPSACWAAPSRRWAGRATAVRVEQALCGAADNHAPGGGPRPTQQGLSRKHLVEACEQAAALRAELSGPVPVPSTGPGHVDPEIAWTMHTLVQQGRSVLGHFGMAGGRHRDAVRLCRAPTRVPPQLEQPQYSLFHRERVEHEYRPLVERRGLGLTTRRRWPQACWPAGMTRACRRIRGWRRRASAGSGFRLRRPPGGDAAAARARRGR